MIATSWPGSIEAAAGAVTCASTLPTATAMPSGRPVQAAASGGQPAGQGAQLGDRLLDLVGEEAGEVRVQRRQVVRRRVGAVLADRLVARRAGVAHVGAAQLPDDPVGRLDPVVHPVVDLAVLLEQLQALGQLPLRGQLAAVAGDPRLAALVRQRVDPLGVRLGGVVLPQLDVGVRPVGQLRQLAQRGAVGQRRQHGAGGEVGADADDLGRVHAARASAAGTASRSTST
jgi:hypothetical protein